MIEAINRGKSYVDDLNDYLETELKKGLNEERAKDLISSLNNPLITNLEEYMNRKGRISLNTLNDISEVVNNVKSKIDLLKEDIELEEIHINGELYNWDKIEKIYKTKVKKEFPNLNFKKLKEWLRKPKKLILNEKGEAIYLQPQVIKKLNVAIIQSIFDEMDFWSMACGNEGSGKSCLHSQFIWYVYSLFKDVGLINYKYDLKQFTKASVKELLNELEDEDKQDELFNIYLLDEAEDLLRANHANAENKRFIRYMRRGRKKRAFVFLNTPQMGEINISVTLARVNFVFDVQMNQDPTTGLMKRGDYNFYIIPRGKEIYSYKYRINILSAKIKDTLLKTFEKKSSYYAGLPKELMVCNGNFKNVWGFDHKEYKEHMKVENLERELEGDIKITERQAELIFQASPKLRFWNFEKDEITEKKTKKGQKDYDLIRKFMNRLGKKMNIDGKTRD